MIIKQKSMQQQQPTLPAAGAKTQAPSAQPGSQRIPVIPGSQNQGTLVAKGSYISRAGMPQR